MNNTKLFTITAISRLDSPSSLSHKRKKKQKSKDQLSDVAAGTGRSVPTRKQGGKLFVGKNRERTIRLSSKKVATCGVKIDANGSREQARREQRAQKKGRNTKRELLRFLERSIAPQPARRVILAACLKVRFFPKGGN